ncbi:hypothetical protein [Paraburkholderia xenovorans]|uniref:hypothetical protein n=1 Tax=Paraburkholderia xenovorans TaxID=36873 RepID=UPI0038B6FED3
MSKPSDERDTSKTDVARQKRLGDQFEIAKKIYAAHSLHSNAPAWGLDWEKINDFLEDGLIQFQAAGGDAQTGTNALGGRGPHLRGENGDIFDYGIGRLLAETSARQAPSLYPRNETEKPSQSAHRKSTMHQWKGEIWKAASVSGEVDELRDVRRADGGRIEGATWDAMQPGDQINLVLLEEGAIPTGEVVKGAFKELRERFPEWHLAGWFDGFTD